MLTDGAHQGGTIVVLGDVDVADMNDEVRGRP